MSKTRAHNPNHEQDALDEGISALWRRGPLRALLAAVSGPVQALESLMYGVALAGSLGSATGRSLDLIGVVIGEYRRGLTDAEYRRVIQAAVWAARSEATREELLRIFRLLVGEEGNVEYYDRYPAGVELVYLRADELTDAYKARISRLIRAALPLGVGVEFASVDIGGGLVFGGLDPGDEVGGQFGGLDPGDEVGDPFGGRW